MIIGKAIHVACLSFVMCVLAATFTGASTPTRMTYFTFSAPVRVTGILLPAGTYVFEIANPYTSSNVVRVLDRKRSKLYVAALTRPVMRPRATRLDATIVFGEAGPSTPRPIAAWYPQGDTTGREFLH
jgi:hypothetical protein